jgi:hypothetical protein
MVFYNKYGNYFGRCEKVFEFLKYAFETRLGPKVETKESEWVGKLSSVTSDDGNRFTFRKAMSEKT